MAHLAGLTYVSISAILALSALSDLACPSLLPVTQSFLPRDWREVETVEAMRTIVAFSRLTLLWGSLDMSVESPNPVSK